MKIKALQRKLLGLDAFQARFRVDVSDSVSAIPSASVARCRAPATAAGSLLTAHAAASAESNRGRFTPSHL